VNSSHGPPPVLALDDAMDVDAEDDAALVDDDDDATLVDELEVDDAWLDEEVDDALLDETKPVEELTSLDPPSPPCPPVSPMVSVPCAQLQPTMPKSAAMNRTAPVGLPLLRLDCALRSPMIPPAPILARAGAFWEAYNPDPRAPQCAEEAARRPGDGGTGEDAARARDR
jgi:hypothetical protein